MKIKLIILLAFLAFAAKNVEAAKGNLVDPATNSFQKDSVKITLSGGPGSGYLIQLIFSMTGGYYYNTASHADTVQLTCTGTSMVFYINPATLKSSTITITPVGATTSIQDGTYDVTATMNYMGSLLSYPLRTNVQIDTKTLPDTIFKPSNGATVGSSFVFYDSTYESNKTGTKKLILAGVNNYTLTLQDAQKDSFALNTLSTISSSVVASSPSSLIAEGTYTITLSYQDTSGHAAATTSCTITIDRTTQTPSIISPASNSKINSYTPIQYMIPERPSPGSVSFYIVKQSPVKTSWDSTTLVLSNAYGSVDTIYPTGLIDTVYNITLSYNDSLGNPATTFAITNITLDNQTDTAIVSWPLANSIHSDTIHFNFTIPESYLANSVTLNIDSDSSVVSAIPLKNVAIGNNSILLNVHDLLDTNFMTSVTSNFLNDGTYSFNLSYQDSLGNPVVVTTVSNIYVDTKTLAPSLLNPQSNRIYNNIPLQYELPETAYPGSVKLIFDSAGTEVTDTLTMSDESPLSTTYLNPHQLAAVYPVMSATNDSLSDGVYNVTLLYQDDLQNAVASVTDSNITIDTHTQTPIILQPATSSKNGSLLNVIFTIPETYTPGTLELIFNGVATDTFVLQNLSVGTDTFALNVHSFSSSTCVQSYTSDSLSDGVYSITLSYQDALDNPAASTMVSNVTIDTHTQAPVINSPASYSAVSEQMNINFTIPEAYFPGSVMLAFSNADTSYTLRLQNLAVGDNNMLFDAHHLSGSSNVLAASSDSMIDGLYNITLIYIDSLGNPSASVTDSSITLDTYTQTPSILLPFSNSASSTPLKVKFVLPEMYSAGSLKLIFDSAGTVKNTVILTGLTTGIDSVMLNINSMNSSAHVQSASVDSLVDGIYNITLSYQDALGNAAATAMVSHVTIDTHTQAAIILLPVSSSKNGSLLNVVFTIPENYLPGTLNLIFNNGSSSDVLTLQNLAVRTDTFTLNVHSFSSSVYVQSYTSDSLSDGVYSMTLSYRDTLANPPSSATISNVTIDTHTQAPVITRPVAHSVVIEAMNLNFIIPEAYSPGSVLLSFSNANTSYVLWLQNLAVGDNNLVFDAHHLSSSSNVLATSSDSIIDGLYNITLTYIDSLGNPVASVTDSSITLDTYTQSPSILTPFPNSASSTPLKVVFDLPEMYESGSLQMTFDSAGVTKSTITLTGLTAGIDSVMLNVASLASSAHVQSASTNSLADGIYNITLTYQDTLGNLAASATVSHVTIDTYTQTPVFILPVEGSVNTNPLAISFILPENYLSGSVKMDFDSAGISVRSVYMQNMSVDTNSFTLNTGNLYTSAYVASVVPLRNFISDGTYDIRLFYQDILGNPVATTVDSNITIDTHTLRPVLSSPVNAGVNGIESIALNFSLPENPYSGSVEAVFTSSGFSCTEILTASSAGSYNLTLNPSHLLSSAGVSSGSDSLPDGSYTVYISYQDALGNPAAASDTGSFLIDRMTQSPVLIQPNDNAMVSTIMDVSFSLPEVALNSNATLVLAGNDTISIVVQTNGSGLQTYALNCQNLASTSSGLVNSTSGFIPEGIYNLTVIYRDTLNNAPASAMQQNITVNYLATGIINETPGGNSLTVYPNPSNGMFTIHSAKTGTFMLMDETGSVIRTFKLDGVNNYTISDESLSAGIYFIMGFDNNVPVRLKLVVLK